MKNFPHQYNDRGKLRKSLETIRDLAAQGADPNDDHVLGYALARAGVYTFRGAVASLKARIAAEQQKPKASQGALTAAREVRRTLRALGWLDSDAGITTEGEALLATPAESEVETGLWQRALWDLPVVDPAGTSHPVRILLRLVHGHTFRSRDGMELALEAVDDSPAELARIRALLSLPASSRIAQMGITQHQARNAVKILPSLALQAGLLALDEHRGYTATARAEEYLGASTLLAQPPSPPAPPPPPRRSGGTIRKASAGDVGTAPNFTPAAWNAMTPDAQLDAIALRSERTARHQAAVRALASHLFAAEAFHEDTGSFDLVSEHSAPSSLVLWEVKTINGDGPAQVRRGIGQLLFYRHFYVRPRWPDRPIALGLAVDDPVSQDLADFLQGESVAAFLITEANLIPLNQKAQDLVAAGVVPLGSQSL